MGIWPPPRGTLLRNGFGETGSICYEPRRLPAKESSMKLALPFPVLIREPRTAPPRPGRLFAEPDPTRDSGCRFLVERSGGPCLRAGAWIYVEPSGVCADRDHQHRDRQ